MEFLLSEPIQKLSLLSAYHQVRRVDVLSSRQNRKDSMGCWEQYIEYLHRWAIPYDWYQSPNPALAAWSNNNTNYQSVINCYRTEIRPLVDQCQNFKTLKGQILCKLLNPKVLATCFELNYVSFVEHRKYCINLWEQCLLAWRK